MSITREVLENLKNSELDEIIEMAKDIKVQRIEYEKNRICHCHDRYHTHNSFLIQWM